MGTVEPEGNAPVAVVVADDDAAVVVVLAREIERGAFATAGHGQGIVRLVAVLEHLGGVIEGRGSRSQQRPPAPRFAESDPAIGRASRDAGRRCAPSPQPVLVLEIREIGVLIDREGRAEGIAGRAGTALLRRNQDDARAGTRAVHRARGRALQHFHVLDVVGIDIDGPVRRRRAAVERAGYRVVVADGIVDRYAVHHDERLAILSADGCQAADLDERRCAWLSRRRSHGDVGSLGGKTVDQVLLAAPDDLRRVDRASHRAKLLHFGDPAQAGDDDLTELERIGFEGEIEGLFDPGQQDASGAGFVSDEPRGHAHRVAGEARRRQRDGVPAVRPGGGAETPALDHHGGLSQRVAVGRGDSTNQRCALLLS